MMLASDQFMQEIRARGIYFLFPRPPGTSHLSICIAEGLEELGISFFAGNDVYAKCLVPKSRGALYHDQRRDELWDRFFAAAPRRLRRSVERYNIVKRA